MAQPQADTVEQGPVVTNDQEEPVQPELGSGVSTQGASTPEPNTQAEHGSGGTGQSDTQFYDVSTPDAPAGPPISFNPQQGPAVPALPQGQLHPAQGSTQPYKAPPQQPSQWIEPLGQVFGNQPVAGPCAAMPLAPSAPPTHETLQGQSSEGVSPGDSASAVGASAGHPSYEDLQKLHRKHTRPQGFCQV